MSYRDQSSTNWGCIASLLLMTPVAMFVLFIGALSGGGCEGREPPCSGDYTPLWIGLLVVIAVALGLAALLNRLFALIRKRRENRNGS